MGGSGSLGRRARVLVTAPRAAGVAGIVSALLLVASFFLIRRGLGGPPTLELLTAGSPAVDDGLLQAGLILLPYVAITFIWFMGVIRLNYTDPRNELFGTVFIATGVLFLGALLVAAAVSNSVIDLRQQQVAGQSGALRLGGGIVYWLLFDVAPRMAGAFILITGNLLRRVGLMPTAMASVSVVVGLAMIFVVRRIDWVVFLFPVWVAAVSILLLVRQRPDLIDVPASPAGAG